MIDAAPADRPETTPFVIPTVATVAGLLVHVPPATLFPSVAVVPVHRLDGPVIIPGATKTVSSCIAVHPLDSV